jgi:glycine betaine/proline transport system substrate-binding protein
MMEVWTSDYSEQWNQILKNGKVKSLGTNYLAVQGWFVPLYMIEGDAERGIEPTIPELKKVQDLLHYKEIFKLSATASKATIYNAPRGWPAELVNQEKLKHYHLSDFYELVSTDSEHHLLATFEQAYKRESPWLGYARDPSIVTAGHKIMLLNEDPYSEEQWELNKACSYPENEVIIAASSGMNEKAPEVLDFLQKYTTTREQNKEMLVYLKENGGDAEQAAQEWLLNNPDIWGSWVPEEIAEKVWAVLNNVAPAKKGR